MAVETAQSGAKPTRGRARRRRDELILDALEQLLADTPLRDLGVEEIAGAAGITRTRFYHYYKSKYEAYAALLQRISGEMLEVYEQPDSWWSRPAEAPPWDIGIVTFHRIADVWAKHGPVLREASDMWNTVPEVREHWQQIMAELTARTRAAIDRERELGVAPPGLDSQRLAESLIWLGERLLFLALIDAPGAMDVHEVAEVAGRVWMRAIYLNDEPALPVGR